MAKPMFTIEGVDAASKALRALEGAVNPSVRKRALVEAAGPIAERMRALVPVLSGDLRDSIAVTADDTSQEVKVGPIGDPAWRAHFIEFGTVNHAAQPFIRPAFDAEKSKAARRVSSTLNASISKSVGGA